MLDVMVFLGTEVKKVQLTCLPFIKLLMYAKQSLLYFNVHEVIQISKKDIIIVIILTGSWSCFEVSTIYYLGGKQCGYSSGIMRAGPYAAPVCYRPWGGVGMGYII